MKAKQFNAVKYGNPQKEEVEEIAKEAVKKTLKEGYKPLISEREKTPAEDTVMPKDKEHLTKNRVNLNEALMTRWFKVSKKEGK